MCGGSDRIGVGDFSSDEEGDGVRAEFVEGGAELCGLKCGDVGHCCVIIGAEAQDDEEVHGKSDHLPPLLDVEFVVNQETDQVLSAR